MSNTTDRQSAVAGRAGPRPGPALPRRPDGIDRFRGITSGMASGLLLTDTFFNWIERPVMSPPTSKPAPQLAPEPIAGGEP